MLPRLLSELLSSSDPPTSASQSAGTIGMGLPPGPGVSSDLLRSRILPDSSGVPAGLSLGVRRVEEHLYRTYITLYIIHYAYYSLYVKYIFYIYV